MDDKTLEQLAQSLTTKGTELVPFLPYLLQDIWVLGSSPTIISKMINDYVQISKKTKVLDLGCGKGAVSVKLTEEFNCDVLGLDIVPEFIEYARQKALEHKVDNNCKFKVANLREEIDDYNNYDISLWGAVGSILGNYTETLTKLASTVKNGGFIFMDDAFSPETDVDMKFQYEYPTFGQWKALFESCNLELIAYETEGDIDNDNDFNNKSIKKRAEELKLKYPSKSQLFDSYVQSQLDECEDLDQNVTGVTWLLQKK